MLCKPSVSQGRDVGESQPLVSGVRHVWMRHWPVSEDAQQIHVKWGGTGPWEWGRGILSWERPPAGFDLGFQSYFLAYPQVPHSSSTVKSSGHAWGPLPWTGVCWGAGE